MEEDENACGILTLVVGELYVLGYHETFYAKSRKEMVKNSRGSRGGFRGTETFIGLRPRDYIIFLGKDETLNEFSFLTKHGIGYRTGINRMLEHLTKGTKEEFITDNVSSKQSL